MRPSNVQRAGGFTVLEVLVTVVILTFGLLGLAGLHGRVQLAEVEAYQRAQALLLLNDMVARLNANRKNALNYVTASPLGTDNATASCTGLTGADYDLCQWNNALLGAGETVSGDLRGAMIGARGCVQNTIATMPREFLISVVWQGVTPTVAPTTTCGQGSYGNDNMRRALTARVTIGCLQNDPTTGLCVTP